MPKVVALRVKYASYVKQEKDKEKNEKKKRLEEQFKDKVDKFRDSASTSAAESIFKNFNFEGVSEEEFKPFVSQAINKNLPDMGIKRRIDSTKKKLLISHSGYDKPACDFVFELLLFNGIPAEEIIYTSSDNPESVIPGKAPIFEYLRDFFVESYSTERIYVIYVLNQ